MGLEGLPTPAFPYGLFTPTGRFIGPTSLALATNTYGVVSGRLIALPVYIAQDTTAVAISVETTTPAGTTGKLRLGIWKDNGAGYPGVLVLDVGTANEIDLTTAAGVKSVTIAQTLPPGLYWLALAAAYTGTQPVLRAGGGTNTHNFMGVTTSQITGSSVYTGYADGGGLNTWASGNALPNPYTAGQSASGMSLPFILLAT